ncbi:MAG: hypothetical protein ACREA0_33080, partial [bacterium]
MAVARRFYETHEDAYEFLIVFTSFNFDLGGAFAFHVPVSNDVIGIGPDSHIPVFNSASSFGSTRLESLLNMGSLQRYPLNPAEVFFRGSAESTLSILGHEAGHRFLSYVRWNDPQGSASSTALLGRGLQHWSFYFNSDASFLEGNRFRDNGNGTFATTGASEHYSALDQYLMGLRAPQEVEGTFLVKTAGITPDPARPPELGVTVFGSRENVTVDQIIAANGPRIPSSLVAPKNFNFAFVLVIPRNASPDPEQVAHLDRIRREWGPFFAQATGSRARAGTELVRGLRWTRPTLGLFPGSEWQAQVELLSTAPTDVTVALTTSDPSAVVVPPSAVIPAGSRSA